MPPAERDKLLAQLKAQEAQLRDPKLAERIQQGDEARRAEAAARNPADVWDFEERFPADPNRIVITHELAHDIQNNWYVVRS